MFLPEEATVFAATKSLRIIRIVVVDSRAGSITKYHHLVVAVVVPIIDPFPKKVFTKDLIFA